MPGKQLDGEKIPGDLDSWDYMGTDPNEILRYSYDILSQRSTTLYHNHPPVKAAINKHTDYAIGQGLVFNSQPDWKILGITPEAAEEWGNRFQKLIHYVSELLNFYEKQSVLFRTSLIMGDSLLLFDRNTPPDGLPFDVIETGGDQIDSKKTGTTLGVYTDAFVRRQALSLNDQKVYFKDENSNDQNVIQFYLKDMARQVRGYPLSYGIVAAAKNNDRWWDATLARVVLETAIFGSSSGELGGEQDTHKQIKKLSDSQKQQSGTTGNDITQDTSTQNILPLTLLSYRGNRDIKFTTLQTPSNNFQAFQSCYLEIVGMGTKTPPEVFLSKYSTSFTAHKGAFNDFIVTYMSERKTFVKSVNKVVTEEIAKYLFMSGLIEMPHPAFFSNPIIRAATLAGNYLGPVPGHINPLQEVKAKIEAVDNAFMLRSDAAAHYGNDFENIISDWQRQKKMFENKSDEEKNNILKKEIEDEDEKEDEEKE